MVVAVVVVVAILFRTIRQSLKSLRSRRGSASRKAHTSHNVGASVRSWSRLGLVRSGLLRPLGSATLIEKAVRTLEKSAIVRPDGLKDMPDQLTVSVNTEQFQAVGRYREEIESAIARGAADRARFNGWPHAAVRVRLVLDQGQTEPVSIGVRFDNPLDMLRPGTSVAEPLGINLEQVESDSGAERIENVPVASPWVLSIADGKTVQLYTDRWYHLGADGDNDVVLDDPYVSGVHASVYATELDLQIEDGSPEGAPSTNGTWVNGFAVKSFLARVGDEITVSLGPDTVIEVICHDQTARGHS